METVLGPEVRFFKGTIFSQAKVRVRVRVRILGDAKIFQTTTYGLTHKRILLKIT